MVRLLSMEAPIILFVYNRLEHTKKTVAALQKNQLASESILYVFADGPKLSATEEQKQKVWDVQKYVLEITGFKDVIVETSLQNKGLANSVIYGVTKVINQHGKVIVVEDDIVTHPFFLQYMNDSLDAFYQRKDIFMIGGYNYNIKFPRYYKDDIYIVHRSCSWGWATWQDRWTKADWDVCDFELMCNSPSLQAVFNRGGGDMFPMLKAQMNGEIDSWAIRWDYCMYKNNALCVHPVKSFCYNSGFDGSGVHCGHGAKNSFTAPIYAASEYRIILNKTIKQDPSVARAFAYFQEYGGENIPSSIDILLKKTKALYCGTRHKVARLFHRRHVAIGGILMLHRVDEPNSNGIWYNQHLKISTRTIEEIVHYARKHKCKFVSLDEMIEAIRKKKNVRRWIAVTLDDGYRDNFNNGSPVFHQLNVPYTIYICTKIVKGEMLYWWEILEQLILEHNEVCLSNGQTYYCPTKETKEETFLALREIILKLPQDDLLGQLQKLFDKYQIDFNYGNNTHGLTWEQIRQLCNDPIVTIGNHTYSHLSFTGCKDEEICADIEKAAKEMYTNVGVKMNHFAFPYGEATAVSLHDIDLVKQLGFKSSATTRNGLISYGTNPLELPRIFVTEKNWKQVIDRIVKYC